MPGSDEDKLQRIKFFDGAGDAKLVLRTNFNEPLSFMMMKIHVVVLAVIALLSMVHYLYHYLKKDAVKEKSHVKRGRVARKPKYYSESKLVQVNIENCQENKKADLVEAPVEKIMTQNRVLAQLSSQAVHAVVTRRVHVKDVSQMATSSATPDPVNLVFPSGSFTLAELSQNRLMAESHGRHCPEDTFVIFEPGDESVSSTIQTKSTQLAKKGKQGVVFYTQEERNRMPWDAKLKIFGKNGKGDQRYLGKLETTAVSGKTYGLLVFSSNPVSHKELKRQQKHRH